jgi:ketosteroid isomerase-like protein
VFGDLSGEQAGTMWRMLTSRSGSDLHVELAEHEATDETGSARWIARYTFSETGRPVVNDIRASFRFAGGRIVEHVDEFSFWAWSRQALGAPGLLLGWTPVLPLLLRRKVRARLERFANSA